MCFIVLFFEFQPFFSYCFYFPPHPLLILCPTLFISCTPSLFIFTYFYQSYQSHVPIHPCLIFFSLHLSPSSLTHSLRSLSFGLDAILRLFGCDIERISERTNKLTDGVTDERTGRPGRQVEKRTRQAGGP